MITKSQAYRHDFLRRFRESWGISYTLYQTSVWRLSVIATYTRGEMGCQCCGWAVSDGEWGGPLDRLQIDHVGGNGKASRVVAMRGRRYSSRRFFQWLRQEGYPEGFRVLCAGCNAMIQPGARRCLLHV